LAPLPIAYTIERQNYKEPDRGFWPSHAGKALNDQPWEASVPFFSLAASFSLTKIPGQIEIAKGHMHLPKEGPRF
jgi:hypothetical protein